MAYLQIRPGPPVRSFVQCYWALEDDAVGPPLPQRVVPDGCPELILNFGQPFESLSRGDWKAQPQSFVAGQLTNPLMLRSHGPARIFGIRFRAHGLSRLFALSMNELTDRVIPLRELSGALWRELEPLHDLASPFEQAIVVERALQAFRSDDALVSYAVDEIVRQGGVVDVADLASQVGISLRQLERRFQNRVGLSPKLFCRVRRFQRVFGAIEKGPRNWADAAVECGYYDQAHLIRDFRELAGETPAALLARKTDLAAHFVEGLGASHSSNTSRSSST